MTQSNPMPACLVTASELDALRWAARDHVVLELGTWKGRTAAALSHVARVVWTVDHHRGDRFTGPCDTAIDALQHFNDEGARADVVMVVGTFDQVADMLRFHCFDLVFVDGDHDRSNVQADIYLAEALVKPSGVIAVHDQLNDGVQAATQELLGAPGHQVESLGMWRRGR